MIPIGLYTILLQLFRHTLSKFSRGYKNKTLCLRSILHVFCDDGRFLFGAAMSSKVYDAIVKVSSVRRGRDAVEPPTGKKGVCETELVAEGERRRGEGEWDAGKGISEGEYGAECASVRVFHVLECWDGIMCFV